MVGVGVRRRDLIALSIAGLASVVLALLTPYITGAEWGQLPLVYKPSCVGVIRLSGVIAMEEEAMPLAFSRAVTPEKLSKLLEKAACENCRAVVLVIDSPGGSATASYLMYSEIVKFKAEHNVTVVAYIAESGLSGGYFVALASDYIMASPTSLVGSVGAIMTVMNYAELLEKLGIRVDVVKSGRFKDVASPYRSMTAEERAMLDRIVRVVYDVFRDVVVKRRGDKLRADNLTDVLNAAIYCGRDALAVGLVDGVGTLDDAIAKARELASLPEDAPVREIREERRLPGLGLLGLPSGEGEELRVLAALGQLLSMPIPAIKVLYLAGGG